MAEVQKERRKKIAKERKRDWRAFQRKEAEMYSCVPFVVTSLLVIKISHQTKKAGDLNILYFSLK